MDTDAFLHTIKALSDAVDHYRKEYDESSLEIDISVFNGTVNFRIKVWSKVGFYTLYSTHAVCDSHAEACLVQNILNVYINKINY